MILHETSPNEFIPLKGKSFRCPNNSAISIRSLNLWSDEDLAEANLYRPAPPDDPPEGYRHTGATRYERIDGVVRAVRDVEPVPPPQQYHRIILKRVAVERLIELGLAEAADMALKNAPAALRLRWDNLRDGPFDDDADFLAVLGTIGADQEYVLAPHPEDIFVPVEAD